jgi:hypothetical protein
VSDLKAVRAALADGTRSDQRYEGPYITFKDPSRTTCGPRTDSEYRRQKDHVAFEASSRKVQPHTGAPSRQDTVLEGHVSLEPSPDRALGAGGSDRSEMGSADSGGWRPDYGLRRLAGHGAGGSDRLAIVSAPSGIRGPDYGLRSPAPASEVRRTGPGLRSLLDHAIIGARQVVSAEGSDRSESVSVPSARQGGRPRSVGSGVSPASRPGYHQQTDHVVVGYHLVLGPSDRVACGVVASTLLQWLWLVDTLGFDPE